jgi:hypothetical protein
MGMTLGITIQLPGFSFHFLTRSERQLAYPANAEMRMKMQREILAEYEKLVGSVLLTLASICRTEAVSVFPGKLSIGA